MKGADRLVGWSALTGSLLCVATPVWGGSLTLLGHLGLGGAVLLGLVAHVALAGAARCREVEALVRIRKAVESTGDAIGIATVKGDHFYQNPAFTRLFGYTLKEFSRLDIAQVYVKPEMARDVLETAARGERWQGELEMVAKDGRRFPVHLLADGITDGKGRVIGLIGVHRDIEETKAFEAALHRNNQELARQRTLAEQMAERAEEASRAKSDFLANMSHEIRTPMNGVIGLTDLLLDTDMGPEQRGLAEQVGGSARALLGLINDILDFSKIEAGRLEVEAIDFDLEALLREVLELFTSAVAGRELTLAQAVGDEVPRLLHGGGGRLRQILVNLVGNAVKFTPAGEVGVGVELASRTGDQVLLRFTVRDTGVGIPEDKLEVLFDRFTQVDSSASRRQGGTGLGLAISRKLAGLLGGDMGVESRVGRGTTFWFTARFAPQSFREPSASSRGATPPATAAPAASGEGGWAGRRVLLAEDNPINQRVAMGHLKKLGVAVDAVADGAQALRALATAPYDLVLMDCQMPEMDGYEATARIRESGSPVLDREVPVVALTAHAMAGDRERCLGAGMNDYLTKPLSRDALAALLARWL